jgi:murein L,D-transpeptidase YcbB/YkuD
MAVFTKSEEIKNVVPLGKPVIFNGEYTIDEIQSKLNKAYGSAPSLIKKRVSKLHSIVESSKEKMAAMYISEEKLKTISKKKSEKTEVTNLTPGEIDKKTTETSKVKRPNMDRWPSYIQKGDSGSYVSELQKLLTDLKYDVGSHGIDGRFGIDTKNAVIKFQKDHNLDPYGIVGPETREALEKA